MQRINVPGCPPSLQLAKLGNFTSNTSDIADGAMSDLMSLLRLFLQLLMGPYFDRDRDLFENIIGLGDEPQHFLIEFEYKTGEISSHMRQAQLMLHHEFLSPHEGDSRRTLPLLEAPLQQIEAQSHTFSDAHSLPETAGVDGNDGNDSASAGNQEVVTSNSQNISIFQCAIGTRIVSLKKVDISGGTYYKLNLSELLLAADITPSRRAALRRQYSDLSDKSGRGSRTVYWILYSDALPLINLLGLQQRVKAMFDRASNVY